MIFLAVLAAALLGMCLMGFVLQAWMAIDMARAPANPDWPGPR